MQTVRLNLVRAFQTIFRRRLATFPTVFSCGIEQAPLFPRTIYPRHHTFITLFSGQQRNFVCSSGKMKEVLLQPDRLLYVAPDSPSGLDWDFPCQRLGIGIDHRWLGISWNSHRHYSGPVTRPDLWFSRSTPEHPDLHPLAQALRERAAIAPNSLLTLQLCELIYRKVLEILEEPQPSEGASSGTYERILAYLADNLHQPVNRKTVAAVFRLNPDYISRLFSRHGQSFAGCLTRMRIAQAEQLLVGSLLSVGEIAQLCGFSSAGYFVKVFRGEKDLPPQQYRDLQTRAQK